jgi:hypothetical protein
MNKTFLSAAAPTYPVQDQFGTPLIQFGFNKIELAALMIAQGIATSHGGKLFPETIADEAFNIAVSVLEKCDEELKKEISNNTGKIIPSGDGK